MNVITVKPERSRLVAFARWATAKRPKIGTVGVGEFGVPADLFVHAPEELLIGALVDGHRYVSPAEDAVNGVPEPGYHQDDLGQELLGVATPEALTAPGNPEADAAAMVAAASPETVQRAMDAALLATDLAASNTAASGDSSNGGPATDFAPLEDAASDEDEDQEQTVGGDGGPFTCDRCLREFTTERGRDSHRRQAHRED